MAFLLACLYWTLGCLASGLAILLFFLLFCIPLEVTYLINESNVSYQQKNKITTKSYVVFIIGFALLIVFALFGCTLIDVAFSMKKEIHLKLSLTAFLVGFSITFFIGWRYATLVFKLLNKKAIKFIGIRPSNLNRA